MSIPFQGTITRRELVHMFSLTLKKWRIISIICAVLFLCLGATMLTNLAGTRYYWGLNTYIILMLVIFGSYYFWMPYLSAWLGYRNNSEMHAPYTGTISEECVELTTINTNSSMNWNVFHRVQRDGKYVLLFMKSNRRMFMFFPRKYFNSEEDWRNFQVLLDNKVKSGVLKEAL